MKSLSKNVEQKLKTVFDNLCEYDMAEEIILEKMKYSELAENFLDWEGAQDIYSVLVDEGFIKFKV